MRWIMLLAACSLGSLAWQVEAPGREPTARAERPRPPVRPSPLPENAAPGVPDPACREGAPSQAPEALHAACDAGEPDTVLVEPVALDALAGNRLACRIERTRTKPPQPMRLPRGKVVTLGFRVQPPPGHVAEDRVQSSRKVYLSRLASRIRFFIPLRRELELRVAVTEPDGSPAEGAKLDEVVMGGSDPVLGRFQPERPEEEPEEFSAGAPQGATIKAQAAPAGVDGILPVRGVPFLQGERYFVVVSKEQRAAFGELLLGAQPVPRMLSVRLPGARTSLGFGGVAYGNIGFG